MIFPFTYFICFFAHFPNMKSDSSLKVYFLVCGTQYSCNQQRKETKIKIFGLDRRYVDPDPLDPYNPSRIRKQELTKNHSVTDLDSFAPDPPSKHMILVFKKTFLNPGDDVKKILSCNKVGGGVSALISHLTSCLIIYPIQFLISYQLLIKRATSEYLYIYINRKNWLFILPTKR